MGMLGDIVKATSMELKSKTRELKARLIVFWLLKDKNVLLGSTHQLSPKLQILLNHHHHSPRIEFPAVAQEKENKEEDEDAMARMMMMMSKQGIQLVQMHNNNTNHTNMHTDFDHNEEEFEEEEEEEKNNDDDVNVTVKDQSWNFVEDEGITDDPYIHFSKNEELDEDEDYNDDDDKKNMNIDEAADLFIRNFRRQLRLQKNHQNSFS